MLARLKVIQPAVAFVRIGGLGDLLLATPALSETILKFPNHAIYIIGTALWLEVLLPDLWPNVKGIYVTGRSGGESQLYISDGVKWIQNDKPEGLISVLRKFDVVMNMRTDSLRFVLYAWLARVPVRYATCPRFFKIFCTHWAHWFGRFSTIHERDRMLRIVNASKSVWLPFQKKIDSNIEALLIQKWSTLAMPHLAKIESDWSATHCKHKSKTYWLINPTASCPEKAWPADKFRQLCLELKPRLDEIGYSILLTGTKTEMPWLESIARNNFQIVTPSGICEIANLIAGACVFITNTSSLQFVAASVGTQTLVLMGRANPARWGPLGKSDQYIKGDVPVNFKGTLMDEEVAAYRSISVEKVLSVAQIL